MSENRVIFVPHSGEVMTEAQMTAALSALNERHPARRAITQLLEVALARATVDASDPNYDPGKGTHAGGRIEAIAELRTDLEGRWGQIADVDED